MHIEPIKRTHMITKMIDILTLKTEKMTPERSRKIPALAKIIEHMLYMSANSEEDYLDDKNIRHRINKFLVGL